MHTILNRVLIKFEPCTGHEQTASRAFLLYLASMERCILDVKMHEKVQDQCRA
jgi:hypothetical protein